VKGLVHHSDAGSQYPSIRYTDRLLEAGVLASTGTVRDSYDALAESVNGLYKTELVRWEGPWRGLDDLELATLGYIDWFNHTRLQSSLDYQTQPSSKPTTAVTCVSRTEIRYWNNEPWTRLPDIGRLTFRYLWAEILRP
jgi:transposase InsO family protein